MDDTALLDPEPGGVVEDKTLGDVLLEAGEVDGTTMLDPVSVDVETRSVEDE